MGSYVNISITFRLFMLKKNELSRAGSILLDSSSEAVDGPKGA